MVTGALAGKLPGEAVLDLCAAPGGKTSALAEQAGILVSNEYVEKRARVLSSNVERMGYRNVIVLKKMTFPDDKVLTIEMSEKQISGRNISMALDYEDVLAADTFDSILLSEE